MLALSIPWWELLVRSGVVYLMVLILLRLTGKRQVGQFTPFDLVLLLLISEGASNAIRANENSLTGAFLVIIAMLAANWTMGKISSHSKLFERLMEGRPRFLIRNGKVDYDSLRKESIAHNDLLIALRSQQCFSPHQAAYAVLETDGTITICKKQARES